MVPEPDHQWAHLFGRLRAELKNPFVLHIRARAVTLG